MPCDEGRAQLAAQQAELVLRLTGQGQGPERFDPTKLAVAAAVLKNKRARSVAQAWPGLAAALGERFAERFAAYAEHAALPVISGPLSDGCAFAQALKMAHELPDAGRLELMAVYLRYRRCQSGLVPRRGPSASVAWLREQRRFVLAGQLPWLGECWIWGGLHGFGWKRTRSNQ